MAAIAVAAGGMMMICCSSSMASLMMGGDGDDTTTTPTTTPTIPTPDPEVFWVGGDGRSYEYTKAQAAATCTTHGAVVATDAQLTSAHAAGADWCATGWLADVDVGRYPITTTLISGCGNGEGSDPAIMTYTPGKAGVNCYGIKPDENTTNSKIIHKFNGPKWSRHD